MFNFKYLKFLTSLRTLIYNVFIILVFISCSNEKIIDVTYYENNNIETIEIEVGSQNTIVKNYYESGDLQAFLEKKNGERHGRFEYYYENGRIMQEGNFSDGLVNGIFKDYYDNGILKRSRRFKNGKLFGCCDYKHRGNGDVRKVGLYNFNGELVFDIEFNSEKDIVSTEGSNISVLVNRNKVAVGDSIEIKIDKYEIPNMSNVDKMYVKKNGKMLKDTIIANNSFSMKMLNSGNYLFSIESTYFDDKKTYSFLDSSFEFEVLVY